LTFRPKGGILTYSRERLRFLASVGISKQIPEKWLFTISNSSLLISNSPYLRAEIKTNELLDFYQTQLSFGSF
jgi:hypothetical protein